MRDASHRQIVVVGDGACAWMAAATLARRLGRVGYEILVAPPADASWDELFEAETGSPSLAAFHAMLGISEQEVLRWTGGTPSLGLALAGWSGEGSTAFIPYGPMGAPLGSVSFHQMAARLRDSGKTIRLTDYAVAALAAQTGRFLPDMLPHHGLHLNVRRYGDLMRAVAQQAGARLTSAPFARVRRDEQGVGTVVLADGQEMTPLLVVDCSGPARLAIEALAPRFVRWSDWLPCDRVSVRVTDQPAPPLYAQALAEATGWSGILPLATGSATLRCFVGDLDPEEDGSLLESGRLAEPWLGNCVALGGAAAMMEPLFPAALHLVQTALARLLSLLPASPHASAEQAEYNRMAANELDSARDYLVLHHALSARRRLCHARRSPELPPAAAYKRDLFSATARIVMSDDEVFEVEDWIAMFEAQQLRPRRYDALADGIPLSRIEAHFTSQREQAIVQVRSMPPWTTA